MLTCLLASLATKTNSCTILVPNRHSHEYKMGESLWISKTKNQITDEYQNFKLANKPPLSTKEKASGTLNVSEKEKYW